MPDLTIFCLVVTYNATAWIEKCFGSLLKSEVPLKVIAIDNASSDDTVRLITKKFPSVEVIESGSNLGFGQANNIGLKMALREKADYVFLLNQDAWIREDTVGHLVRVSADNGEYGILSPFHLDATETRLERLFEELLSAKHTGSLISDLFFGCKNELYHTDYIHAASWFVSKQCIKKVGGFDPLYFHYGEDDDYLQRVKYFKFKIGLVPSAVIVHDSVFKSWDIVEWDRNRNMVVALQQLKRMSPHFRSNVLTFFKSGFDELTTLLMLRKFRKFRFRLSILFNTLLKIKSIQKSFKSCINEGAYLQ